jgi:hypothetical protein
LDATRDKAGTRRAKRPNEAALVARPRSQPRARLLRAVTRALGAPALKGKTVAVEAYELLDLR